jgi:3-oxoacyl-[acyl-carrier protein] reductase
MDLHLTGKSILVTGGTRGIGGAIGLRAAEEGADVAICGRDAARLELALAALRQHGHRAFGTALEALTPGAVESFVDGAAAHFGRLDGVVANIGGTFGGNFLEATPEEWLKTLETNLVHAVRTIRAAVPHLQRSGGGSVVIIASISGSRPGPRSQYGAAKAGEIFVAQALARELAEQRIRVNAVSPGSIMFEGGSWAKRREQMPERLAEFIAKEFPWGRMGTLDEVADVATFLLSSRSTWINGTNIVVDGAQGAPSIRM